MNKKTIATTLLCIVMATAATLIGCGGTSGADADTVTVYFDTGTDLTLEPLNLKPNEQYGDLPAIERNYYKFLGWEIPASDERFAEDITSTSIMNMTFDHTLQAKWKYIGTDAPSDKYAVGNNHALILDDDGYIWAWGKNDQGQLGDGTKEAKSSPVKLRTEKKFKKVFANMDQSYAIDVDGGLWAWGAACLYFPNGSKNRNYTIPCQIYEDMTFITMSPGNMVLSRTAFMIDTEYNLWQQYMLGHTSYRLYQVGANAKQVVSDYNAKSCVALLIDGSLLYADYSNRQDPIIERLASDTEFTEIAVDKHNKTYAAIDTDGGVWLWGALYKYVLGTKTGASNPTPTKIESISNRCIKVALAGRNGFAIDEYNNLWAWGYEFYDGDGNNSSYDWAYTELFTPTVITGILTDIKAANICSTSANPYSPGVIIEDINKNIYLSTPEPISYHNPIFQPTLISLAEQNGDTTV